MKKHASRILYIATMALLLWVSISGIIQAFKCPKMTQAELLLHTPKSIICDWQKCN